MKCLKLTWILLFLASNAAALGSRPYSPATEPEVAAVEEPAPPKERTQEAQFPNTRVSILFTDPRQVETHYRDGYYERQAQLSTDIEVLNPANPPWPKDWKARMVKAEKANVRGWIDWDLWGSLNQEAQDIWQTMVRCNLGDTELARMAYFYARNLCSRSESEGQAVFERQAQFHGKVRDFIRTTRMRTVQWEGQPQKTDDEKELHEAYVNGYVPLHPLFAQAALEYLSTVSRFFFETALTSWQSPIPPRWIDVAYSRSFMERVDCVLFQTPGCLEWPTGIPDNPGSASHARSYVNAHLIVRFFGPRAFSDESRSEPFYSRFGLWPRASLTLLKIASWQYPRRSAWKNWSIEQSFDAPISKLTRNMPGAADLCNQRNKRTLETCPIVLSRDLEQFSGSIVQEFRALAQRYGYETSQAQQCDPEKKDRCFAVDPSNPNVKTDPFDWN